MQATPTDAPAPDDPAPKAPAPVELIVCVTCRQGAPADPDAPRPGALLLEALAGRDLPPGVAVKPTECLSNCKRGCSIALRGAGRWTYIYGDLDAARDVDAVVEGARRYHDTSDGLVPWRERPEHFRRHCIARIPPLEALDHG